MRTLLTNATLIDCVEPVPRPATSVLIEDGSIKEIRPTSAPIAGGDGEVGKDRSGFRREDRLSVPLTSSIENTQQKIIREAHASADCAGLGVGGVQAAQAQRRR